MKYFFRKTGDKSRVGFTYAETKTLFLLSVFLLFPSLIFAQDKLNANYDSGEELILIERMPVNVDDKGFHQFIYSNTIPLGSIYWNSNNNQYYYVKDGTRLTKTNGLTYKLDPIKQQEPSFIGEPQDLELVYAGYISSNQRLYINPKTKEQFIKILTPIDDKGYILTPKFRSDYPEKKWWSIDYWRSPEKGNSREPTDGSWDGLLDNF